MAGAGRDVADQRPAHWALSPAGFAAQPGKAAGHGAPAAVGFDPLARARNSELRLQPDTAAFERTTNSGIDGNDTGRVGTSGGAGRNAAARTIRREQSPPGSLHYGRGAGPKKAERVTRGFSS